ncbi:MAG TPA: OmpA family protein [Chitinophagaceae bacterium]|nr:OmpA family protein [Chitinophagaceae bacterium]MCC6634267.1 OmpA family protein [Chitinophagaceae bacterium]HMZ46475.1 OmpA family protein [Chitinophagaceae bacterium]HNM34369.1 OmpA family protein [Chitinophagaceae bacterium]HNN30842.1 OmpA family protein [Chitinophagaceae bacterium]
MTKIKLILSLVVFIVFSNTINAQLGGVHNYSDSSYISPRDMKQQSDFMGNKGSFPSKPRDQWQFGIFAGYPYVDGDCATTFKGLGKGLQAYSYGFGISLRKAMGYVFSVRGSFAYYNMLGLDYQPNSNFNNSQVIRNLYENAPRGYIHNHRTMAFTPSLEGLVSLSNIMFHTKQKRWNIYGLFGYGALIYNTKMNMMKPDGSSYATEFQEVANAYTSGVKRVKLRAMLREKLDGSYETMADVNDRRPGLNKNWHLRHCFTSGVGIEYRMGKRWSMTFEYKRMQTRDDYVDGWYRQSGDLRYAVFTSEWDNVAFAGLGANFNIGNSKKRVPPLWWLNPLEFAYADLANNKAAIAKMFKVKDDDNDGVMNELDLEPNTPEGCPVDTHGVTADTDGDGVPDCKDKEKLTLQKCFPVDADGVGNCPEPACCDSLANKIQKCCTGTVVGNKSTECTLEELPSIQFYANSYKLSKDAEAILSVVADKMKNNPNCNLKVVGYGNKTKAQQQLSWDRVNAIIRYLVEQQGIAENRFIFTYGNAADGDILSVDLLPTMETGPNTVQPPHPQLRKASNPAKKKGLFNKN